MTAHLVCVILAACTPTIALSQPTPIHSKCGRLERVVLQLQYTDRQTLVVDVKKHLGPSGLVVMVGDQLVVQDTAANVEKIKYIVAAAEGSQRHHSRNASAQKVVVIREIIESDAPSRDLEIIRLRHATATETAKVLDELFNDRAKPSRLRIVPDPATNALLVKGALLDLVILKALVRKELDLPRELRVYKLKDAAAENVAKILSDFLREEKGLNITHDPRTNSVLVRCPAALDDVIGAVIIKLDKD